MGWTKADLSLNKDAKEQTTGNGATQVEDGASPNVSDAISVTTYPFTTASGTALEDMSSGTTALIGTGSDDGTSGLKNIGFDFWFNGVRYTQFDSSEWLYPNGRNSSHRRKLGDFSNSLASVNEAPVIAPYWDDLATGTNGNVIYKTIGSAPNRKMIVQWFRFRETRAVRQTLHFNFGFLNRPGRSSSSMAAAWSRMWTTPERASA